MLLDVFCKANKQVLATLVKIKTDWEVMLCFCHIPIVYITYCLLQCLHKLCEFVQYLDIF